MGALHFLPILPIAAEAPKILPAPVRLDFADGGWMTLRECWFEGCFEGSLDRDYPTSSISKPVDVQLIEQKTRILYEGTYNRGIELFRLLRGLNPVSICIRHMTNEPSAVVGEAPLVLPVLRVNPHRYDSLGYVHGGHIVLDRCEIDVTLSGFHVVREGIVAPGKTNIL